jgi:hypothetical protein
MNWIAKNKLFLLFLALVGLQALTWRSVLDVRRGLNAVDLAIHQTSCGGIGAFDRACRVVIVPP